MNKLLTNQTIFIKNWFLLISIAIVGGLAFAPFNQPLAFFYSFYGLFHFLYQAEKFSDFLKKSLIFNFCYFLSQLYWVAWSVKVYGMPELMPLALIGLPFILCLFPTICLIPSFYKRNSIEIFGWTAGIGIGASEIMRSFMFTGFPWNLSGYIWDLSLLQSCSIFGIFGLSLLTIAAATVIFTRQKITGIAIFSSLLALWVHGYLKLQEQTELTQTTVRIIQPCINQEEKWKPEFFKENMNKLEILTQLQGEKNIDITIWPEAAVPACINEFADLQKYLSQIIKHGVILTGAPRRSIQQHICNFSKICYSHFR
jgi:apolipoprotein N-acyltransferase